MRTALDGPVILYGNDNPQQNINTDAGPNIDFQSNALIDSRYTSQAVAFGEGVNGGVLALHNPVQVESISGIYTASNTTAIAAAQSPTVGGFFTLTAANATGIAINIPLIPQGNAIIPASTNLVNVIALDFGFALGTTTTAAATATTVTITGPSPAGYSSSAVYATRFFYPGQRIAVSGAGNAAGTLPLLTTVLATDRYASPGVALAAAGTITIANPALFAGANAAIGTVDQEYGVAVKPIIKAGAARVYDPSQMTSRNVSVTASGASSGTVTVRGYDIYEQAMSSTVTIVGTGTALTAKTFAYVSSVQLNLGSSLTGTLSIGTGNTLGLAIRSDLQEYLTLYVNGVAVAPSGYNPADQTFPATALTGDVRGSFVYATALPNGVNRYTVQIVNPAATAFRANNIDARGIFGVTNA